MAAGVVLLLAAALRLMDLDAKPLHHDEGVNGHFVTQLFREGIYRYDPANYHGPTLYYCALFTTTLNSFLYGKYGLSTFAIRLVPALFGIAAVWLILRVRTASLNYSGLFGAALLASSPAAVYLSRYFIHEMVFVFFTLALVIFAHRFQEERTPRDLILTACAAALLFATKETAVVTTAVLVLAAGCTELWMRARRPGQRPAGPNPATSRPHTRTGALAWLAAAAVFVNVAVLFYTSFYSNFPNGIFDAMKSLEFWSRTGLEQHRQPWYMYIAWLSRWDLPLLSLGGAAAVVILWHGRDRLGVFAAFWAGGLLFALSIVPYKTPWLALNVIVPLALLAGIGAGHLYGLGSGIRTIALVAVVLAAVGVQTYAAIALSFRYAESERNPFVYQHTQRDVLRLIAEVQRIGARHGTGTRTTIEITAREYWPLPWYLRDYPNVGYHGKVVRPKESLVIASGTQLPEIQPLLGGLYTQRGHYILRPGVELFLFEKN